MSAVAVLNVGCATTRSQPGGLFCDLYSPVYPTRNDVEVISDQMADTTLVNNEVYEEQC